MTTLERALQDVSESIWVPRAEVTTEKTSTALLLEALSVHARFMQKAFSVMREIAVEEGDYGDGALNRAELAELIDTKFHERMTNATD